MTSSLNLVELEINEKKVLLDCLGYSVDKDGFIHHLGTGEFAKCHYKKTNIHVDNVSVLPGSVILIDTDEITLAEYFNERASKAA